MSDGAAQTKILGLPVWAFVLIVLVVLAIPAIMAAAVVVVVPTMQERARIVKSQDNLRSLAVMLVDRRMRKGDWPKQDGKAFVLSLVADGALEAKGRDALRVLFSPADVEFLFEDVDPARYADLRKNGFGNDDWYDLTSYVGRRNKTPEHALGPDAGGDEPILADVSPMRVVIIAFADGSVREYDHDELGLDGPYEPGELPLGDDAPHPLLRKLAR